MSWTNDKIFDDGKQFVEWLDKHYGNYITKHINELHVHHTWKPNHGNNQSLLTLHRNMRNYHKNTRGWSDIGQHVSIGKNGGIALGRSIKRSPASAVGYNGNSNWHPFMFEAIGNFDKGHDKLEGNQLATVMAISKYFHNKSKAIKFHREMDNRKSCPGTGISKKWFMDQVRGTKPQSPKPSVSVAKPKSKGANMTTDSIVVYLNSVNKPSMYSDRKRLASANGIKNYRGTASQNTKLLNILRKGGGAKPKPTKSGNSTIKDIQRWVDTPVDGIAGKDTWRRLTIKYQSELNSQFDRGLIVDGIAGRKTFAAGVNVRYGARGNLTRVLQSALYLKGYTEVGKPDGIFLGNTKKALDRFQRDQGLSVDTIAGKNTFSRLFA